MLRGAPVHTSFMQPEAHTWSEIRPLSPVGNVPAPVLQEGVLHRLKRWMPLTDGSGVIGNMFFTVQRQGGKTARGRPPLDEEHLRQPDPNARTAARIDRRRTRVAKATGGARVKSPDADVTAQRRKLAEAALHGLFPEGDSAQAGALVQRLMAFATVEAVPYEQALLIGTVLARQTRGDVAAAAAILDGLCSAEPEGPAFAAQRALANCLGPGMDCLMAASGLQLAPDARRQAVQREAFATRLHVACQFCDRLPYDLRPRSLAGCVALAGHIARDQAGNVRPRRLEAEYLAGHGLLVEGLLCAETLLHDPSADAPPEQQDAYLAVRNGIYSQAALQRTQERLFKVNTYIDRASRHGWQHCVDSVQRLFGCRKNPLGTMMKLGTMQSKTRHPEDDLALRCVAMDAFVRRMGDALRGLPRGLLQPEAVVRKAVRAALVRHWKRHIVEKGWRDEQPVSGKRRRAIAAEVAAQLGCAFEVVLRHPALRGTEVLVASQLARWAHAEGLDFDAPAVDGDSRDFGKAVEDFERLHNDGDVVIENPTPADVRRILMEAIRDTRQTYSVNFSDGNSFGINANIAELLSTVSPILSAGPVVELLALRMASIQLGSNVHGGQFHVGTPHGVHLGFGASLTEGGKIEGVATLAHTTTLMPVSADYTHTRSIVLRTRMNIAGQGPDAWRELLLDAIDAITRQNGETGETGETGEAGGPPANACEAWRQLARRHYKNPDLSIDDLHSHLATMASTLTESAGARAGVGPTQVGPLATATAQKTWFNMLRQKERGANRTTELNVNNAGHACFAGLALVGAAPGITAGALHEHAGHLGAVQAVSMPSASLGSKSISFLRNAAGVTIRLVTDQGRIDADYSVMDTETARADSFGDYIDSRRADWVAALGGDAAAERRLDVFLTRLLQDHTQANMTYGERRRLTPQAARRIDHFRAMAVAVARSAGPVEPLAAAEVVRLEGEVTRVLSDPASWDARSLWALSLGLESRWKGGNLIGQLGDRMTVSAPRQDAVLIADRALRRLAADEAAF